MQVTVPVGKEVTISIHKGYDSKFQNPKTMRKLLIINRAQFGYHIDTFYYCVYLKDSFHVTYLCFDEGRDKIETDGVDVHYVSRKGNLFLRFFKYLLACGTTIMNGRFSLIFIKYFQGCSLLRYAGVRKNMIVDVRSASVKPNRLTRFIYDLTLKIEVRKFENITIISRSLCSRLGLTKINPFILPLGANVLSTNRKKFHELNLLYVGTLYNRKLEETIFGLKLFLEKVKDVQIRYTIIGTGLRDEIENLNKIIIEEKLENIVTLAGYVQQRDLGEYFDNHNIGISFIPMTDYYHCQPPTKTFEYILAGLPVLATRTSEHEVIVDSCNGVLIQDNRDSFCAGLVHFYQNRSSFSSEQVRNSLSGYTWENIVKVRLIEYLNSCCSKFAQQNTTY